MKITLSKEVVKEVVAAKSVTLTELTIQRIVDLPEKKIVRVFMQELSTPVVLWSEASYDAIGQWTDADVENRLKELFS